MNQVSSCIVAYIRCLKQSEDFMSFLLKFQYIVQLCQHKSYSLKTVNSSQTIFKETEKKSFKILCNIKLWVFTGTFQCLKWGFKIHGTWINWKKTFASDLIDDLIFDKQPYSVWAHNWCWFHQIEANTKRIRWALSFPTVSLHLPLYQLLLRKYWQVLLFMVEVSYFCLNAQECANFHLHRGKIF